MDRPVDESARLFVGRESELHALTRMLTEDGHRHGHLILVSGEPGIGKSTLISEAVSRAGEAAGSVLRATADVMDQRRAHGLLLDALGSGDPDAQQAFAAIREQRHSIHAGRSGNSEVTAEQVLDLIDVLAARGPFTLVLEDLQWADISSLDLLTLLCRTLRQLPVVVVASRRLLPRPPALDRLLAEAESLQVLTTIELGPLDSSEAAALTEAVTRARVDESVLRQVAAAGGNPLFLLELLGVLLRDGSLTVGPDGHARLGGELAPAPSLAVMIMNHLGALSAPARELLVLASVLGTRFPIADLRLIAGKPISKVRPALAEAMAAGVLVEDGADALAFRHALIREVLVADVPSPVRGELHLEAATRLAEAGAPAVAVAEHLLRVPPSLELVPLTLELADRVLIVSPETAIELWHRVRLVTPPVDEAHVRAITGTAHADLVAGRTSEAIQLVRDVLRGGTPGAKEIELRGTLAHALTLAGDLEGALAESDRILTMRTLTRSQQPWHLALAGWPRLLLGRTDEALELGRRAELAAGPSGNRPARVSALVLQGRITAARGELAQSLEQLSTAVQLADEEPGVPTIQVFPHQLLASLLADLDRLPESLDLLERGRRLAETLGYLPGVLAAHQLAAQVKGLTGHLSDVETDLEARASMRLRIDVRMEIPTLGMRVWVALHRDGPDAAAGWIRQLGDLREATGVGRGFAWVYAPVSRSSQFLGDTRGAFELLWHGWQRCADRGMVMDCVQMSVQLAELAVALGESGAATEVEVMASAAAERNPEVRHLAATAQVVRGLVTDDVDLLCSGVHVLAATPRRMAHAAAAELAAAALARAGRLPEATAMAESAVHSFREVGANHDVVRARRAFAALGLRLHGPRAAPRPTTGWDSLTRTEETVARQVATGLSNPEVAEILFVSRRTIETHVSHILAKLGLRSRAELVLFVARRAHDLEELGHEPQPPAERAGRRTAGHEDAARGRVARIDPDLDEHASRSHPGPKGVVRGLTDL